ncbi:hypothetical protein [Streptomyces odonnellii]|uniref:hypothetical protein n=1 Tax=Streptomyces odonnellii TaxID=1417980 RepID=UPI000625F796|nr:hypothetical protein [Streptomyces odonnellii]
MRCWGHPTRVAAGTVNDPAAKTGHEVDVAVFGPGDDHGGDVLLAIGEDKWNDTMGVSHLQRLQHIRALLAARNAATTERTRLMCFSGAGFTPELSRTAARDHTIQLVDLNRLYHGE